MEIRQLEAFAAVMSAGSVTAAGRLLGRSQPAVSRSIQELEAEIGYPLFQRFGPRVAPTREASELYQEVERTLASLRQVKVRAEQIARHAPPPLTIAATAALAAGLVPRALVLLDQDHPLESVHLRSAAPEQVVEAVLGGTVDMGVASLPLEHRGVRVHWIGEAACVAALRADDPLAQAPRIALSDFRERRLVTMQNPYRLRPRLDSAFAAAGVRTAGVIETNSSLNALGAVRAGLGLTVLEPVTAYGLPVDGIVIRPLDIRIPFLFGVITPEFRPPGAATLAAADALAKAAAEVLPEFVLHDASQHDAILQALHGDHDDILNPTEEHAT
ncbi:MAG TPA: LysR family transcriptional regulator [Paraburkholderia sp.]|nr:LysR family transcriptional regulator [Paraburkholderia sp.]